MQATAGATVVILTYQRRELLRGCIESALAQDFHPLEVIVVDNASTDGSGEMVAQDFPGVRLLRMPENVGAAGRNRGLEEAAGSVVVTIDDDVRLDSPQAVAEIVEAFSRRPSLACVNFKIRNPSGQLSTRDWCHPRDWREFADQEFDTTYVLEGACAFRPAAFAEVGGYWPPFFLGHEGLDLAFRFLSAGYDLAYMPQIEVTHLVADASRTPGRIYYAFTRNAFWVALRNHRPSTALLSIASDLGLMGVSAVRGGQLGSYLRGIRDGLAGASAAWASRQPIDAAGYRRLRQLYAERPSFFHRIGRHLRERPIES